MTGSTMAVVIIPIVTFLALGLWLTMVFYADAHPMHSSSSPARVNPGAADREQPEPGSQHPPEHAPEHGRPDHSGRKAA
jgi:hypothetical protein